MENKLLISNIVKKEKLREVQSTTLSEIKTALLGSFGPMGSNTCISKDAALNEYTKDGHTILKNVGFLDVLEESVRSDIEDITRHIVKTVGDGTTSAVILSQILFEELKTLEDKYPPYVLMREFEKAIVRIREEILANKQEFTADTAYGITYTSTNGNEEIATEIKKMYERFGKDVFIDVSVSNDENSYIKIYDGMTIDSGYSDNAYINNSKKGVCTLRNPEIYMFADPIDTQEMINFVDVILKRNIMTAYNSGNLSTVVPTVIMAPTISRDMSAYITKLVEFMYSYKDEKTKPPFVIITNIYQGDQFSDVARMCGCKAIRKYIDPQIQQADIEKGLAPTFDTVHTFAGTADIVESDLVKTKFVNPKLMLDEEGNTSDEFKALVRFLETELAKAYEEKQDNNVTGTLKRRINSLKANMVEYLIGGITQADRDSLRALVEDSVLNCRSAAKFGVGRGSNFEALSVLNKLKDESDIFNMLFNAYRELLSVLYATAMVVDDVDYNVEISLQEDQPLNLRTFIFDGKVICSIMTDVCILEAMSKILTIMFTCNQFLTSNPIQNKYL